jgi:hypothetical protein
MQETTLPSRSFVSTFKGALHAVQHKRSSLIIAIATPHVVQKVSMEQARLR